VEQAAFHGEDAIASPEDQRLLLNSDCHRYETVAAV
jgi:hypothetical protein